MVHRSIQLVLEGLSNACSHPYTPAILGCKTKSYTNICSRAASLWNSLPGACFPSPYDLSCFNGNLNSHHQLLRVYLLLFFFYIVALYLEWLLTLCFKHVMLIMKNCCVPHRRFSDRTVPSRLGEGSTVISK